MCEQSQWFGIEAGVEVGVPGGLDESIEVGLARQAGEGSHGDIDRTRAIFGGLEAAGQLGPGSVVCVKVNRQADGFVQGLDQSASGKRLTEPRHVLDGQQVGAPFFQFLGEVDVVLQRVLVPLRIEHIAGVADRGFAEAAVVTDGSDCHLHVRHPVERIEHPEQVDAGSGRFFDERLDDVVWIVCVANGVAGPQQHLKEDVRNLFPQAGQPFPGAFLEEPHGGVKGGPAPHLQGEQAAGHAGIGIRDREHVVTSHSGGQE